MTSSYKGELEVDERRGVIYFHSSETGITLLRISRLPTPIPDLNERQIDIAHVPVEHKRKESAK